MSQKKDNGYRGGESGGRRYRYHRNDDKGASILIPEGFDEVGRPIKFAVKKLKPLNPRVGVHDAEGYSEVYLTEGRNVVWPMNYWWCHDCAHGWSAMTDTASAMGMMHAFETGHHMIHHKEGIKTLRLVGGIPTTL